MMLSNVVHHGFTEILADKKLEGALENTSDIDSQVHKESSDAQIHSKGSDVDWNEPMETDKMESNKYSSDRVEKWLVGNVLPRMSVVVEAILYVYESLSSCFFFFFFFCFGACHKYM